MQNSVYKRYEFGILTNKRAADTEGNAPKSPADYVQGIVYEQIYTGKADGKGKKHCDETYSPIEVKKNGRARKTTRGMSRRVGKVPRLMYDYLNRWVVRKWALSSYSGLQYRLAHRHAQRKRYRKCKT